MAVVEQDFKQELEAVQRQTKLLATKRDGLIREAGIQQQRVTEALGKLKELGVADADKLSVEQLKKLRDKKQKELEAGVAALKAKVADSTRLLAEYEQVGEQAVA